MNMQTYFSPGVTSYSSAHLQSNFDGKTRFIYPFLGQIRCKQRPGHRLATLVQDPRTLGLARVLESYGGSPQKLYWPKLVTKKTYNSLFMDPWGSHTSVEILQLFWPYIYRESDQWCGRVLR